MSLQKIVSLILVILMAIPMVPIMPAQSQDTTPTITTSVSDLGGKFTNNTWVEVRVRDPDQAGTGSVTVLMYKGNVLVDTFTLDEVGSSGLFIGYFLFNSTTNNTDNGWNITGHNYGDVAKDTDVPLVPENNLTASVYYNETDFTVTLDKDDKITFEYTGAGGTVTVDITYVKWAVKPSVSFDRTEVPAFGNATIYIKVVDPTHNFDPTARETAYGYLINFTLVDVLGDEYKGPVEYYLNLTETGANTGVFVGSFTLDDVFVKLGYTGSGNEYYNITYDTNYTTNKYLWVNFTTVANNTAALDHVKVTINENITRNAGYTGTYEVYNTFTLQRETGVFSPVAQVTLADDLEITLIDPDINLDTMDNDTITVNVTLVQDNGNEVGTLTIQLEETGENTGVFKGKVSLLYQDTASTNAPSTFYLNGTSKYLKVEYRDPSENTTTAIIEPQVKKHDPQIEVIPSEALPTDKVTIRITDPDLNAKGDAELDNFGKEVSANANMIFDFGPSHPGKLYVLNATDGSTLKAKEDYFLVFKEVSPGVFEAEFDLTKIKETLSEGTEIIFNYTDAFYDEESYSEAKLTITKPQIEVVLDKEVYPMPNGGKFRIWVNITDPYSNVNPGIADEIDKNKVNLTIILYNDSIASGYNRTAAPENFTETGADTGVFRGYFEVDLGSDPKVFVDAIINVTYTFKGNEYYAEARILPHTAVLTVNNTSPAVGEAIKITLEDPDEDINSTAKDSVSVTVTLGTTSRTVTLEETDEASGVFEAELVVGKDAPFTGGDNEANLKDLLAQDFKVKYTDKYTEQTTVNNDGKQDLEETGTVKSFTSEFYVGSLEGDIEETGPYSKLVIYIKDPDYAMIWNDKDDLDLASLEAKIIVRSELGDEVEFNTAKYYKDEENTFYVEVELQQADEPNSTTTKLEVGVPDDIVIRMIDPVDAEGETKVVIKWVTARGWDGVVRVEPEKAYYEDGETIYIIVEDKDQNKDPNKKDSVQVKITSVRFEDGEYKPVDPAGYTLELFETERDSGVFKAPYTIEAGNINPYFEVGDILNITYTDSITADGESNVITSWKAIQIGQMPEKPIMPMVETVEDVNFTDLQGNEITPTANVPVVLQIPIKNENTVTEVSVSVILVAYKDGVPTYVGISKITLQPGEETTAEVSWIPDDTGEYLLKIFFWDLAEKKPLSPEPVQLTVTVSE